MNESSGKETALINNGRPRRAKNYELKRIFKTTLFRMWAAGAVCFFAAWGRSGSEYAGEVFSVNLIAGLIFVMIVCELMIVNPVIRLLSGRRVLGDARGWRLVLGVPLHIVKVSVLVMLIVQTYYFMNIFFIGNFEMEEDAVPVPLEPILFGILYGIYHLVLEVIVKRVFGRLFPRLFLKQET